MDGLTPQSKTHTWIIVLLVWAILLLMFGIGYMVYQEQQQRSADATTGGAETRCDGVIAALATAQEELANVATCEAFVDKETYSDTLAHPLTFDFPDTWNAYTMQDNTAGVTTISLSAETFGDCNECGGYMPPVPITVTVEKSAVSDPAIFAALEANPFVDVTKTETYRSGTLVSWNDTSTEGAGIRPGEHVAWIGVKNNRVITASYYKAGGSDADDAAWAMLLASIDVSAF